MQLPMALALFFRSEFLHLREPMMLNESPKLCYAHCANSTATECFRRRLSEEGTVVGRESSRFWKPVLQCYLANVDHRRIAALEDLVNGRQPPATQVSDGSHVQRLGEGPLKTSPRHLQGAAEFRDVDRPPARSIHIVLDLVHEAPWCSEMSSDLATKCR